MSTTVPREALIRCAPGFISRNCSAPIISCVCGVSGTCSVTKSAPPSSASSDRDRLRVAERQLGHDVVEDDAHAERFGEHADLRADVPVADDAERLAAHLVRPGRRLVPLAAVRAGIAPRHAAQQHHDLGDDQLGDAARVGERRVEDRHARLSAACRSTWLVPMQKAPMAMSFGAAASTSAVSCVRDRMPTHVRVGDGLLERLRLRAPAHAAGCWCSRRPAARRPRSCAPTPAARP